MNENAITVQSTINAPVARVWECWTKPEHIVNWAFASDDWEAPEAENDLHAGGKFKTVMVAKDGSRSFDFDGTYTAVIENELIEYDIADGRHVKIMFEKQDGATLITQTFEAESEYSREMQLLGWQAIQGNFKKYVESVQS